MAKRDTQKLDRPELYNNRELSWLEFNGRVLRQAQMQSLPLLERLKFLAIFASNLDEFFMIRVAGLMQQAEAGVRKRDPSGLTPRQQLQEISRRCHELTAEHVETMREVFIELRKHGLYLLRRDELSLEHKKYLKTYFEQEIFPALTPLSLTELDPRPLLPGFQLYVAITLEPAGDSSDPRILAVPVPELFARFQTIPSTGKTLLVALEDIITENAGLLCPGQTIRAVDCFRITRDADVGIQEDEAGDLLDSVEKAVLQRRRRSAVRLQTSAHPSKELLGWLRQHVGVHPDHTYEVDGLLAVRSLWEIARRSGYDHLKIPDWPSQPPQDLIGFDSIWEAVVDHDVMLVHPYESFDPVVRLLQEAAEDPNVMAIKQTLYRTSGDSPIISALEQAAENGKEVTVLVELKARFDEARNIRWARRLEDAGCLVIYGVVGLKTHAKALLIIRRDEGRIRRYVHLSTGNYNDTTARLYADIGLITCDPDLAMDVASFFNLLTGFSESVGWSKLVMAPTAMRNRFYEMIDREIKASSPDRPGLIMAKVNSLEDKGICRALYEASRGGVKIRLNIRGICCLRPGLKKISEHIEVVSILDRYLEHARIFYFNNGGHPELYLASADWMGRNLDKRMEILFPVTAPKLKTRLIQILQTYFEDNTQSYQLLTDGSYRRRETAGPSVRAQQVLYENAVSAVASDRRGRARFRPIKQWEKK